MWCSNFDRLLLYVKLTGEQRQSRVPNGFQMIQHSALWPLDEQSSFPVTMNAFVPGNSRLAY
jgi:hypothetical protein